MDPILFITKKKKKGFIEHQSHMVPEEVVYKDK